MFSVPMLRDKYGKLAVSGNELRPRYPHLIRALQYVAILSQGEAVSAIFDFRLDIPGGCEAVAHFGGAVRCIKEAWRTRSTARRLGYFVNARELTRL